MRLTAFLLVTASAFAQIVLEGRVYTPDGELLPGARPASIEGRVVTPGGMPVSRAQLTITLPTAGRPDPSPTQLEVASNDGRFRVDGLVAGYYSLSVWRAGYAEAPGDASRLPRFLLSEGEKRAGITLVLLPLAVITGSVTNPDGTPADRVQVQLLHPIYTQGLKSLGASATATTDDRGQFRFADVPKGPYFLRATRSFDSDYWPLGATGGQSLREADLPTYYPDAPNLEGARRIDADAAPVPAVEIHLRHGSVYTIRGTVQGNGRVTVVPKGTFVPNGSVTPQTITGPRFAIGWAGENFDVHAVPPGEYVVARSYSQPDDPIQQFARVEVVVTKNDVIDVRLAPVTKELRGRVSVEGSTEPLKNMGLRFTPANEMAMFYSWVALNPDGTFVAPNMVVGKYVLSVMGFTGAPASIHLGDRDISNQEIDLGMDGALNIVLKPVTAYLPLALPTALLAEGKEQPDSAGYAVTLWPALPDRTTVRGEIITFHLSGKVETGVPYPPGEYYFAVWETAPPSDMLEIPEFLARFDEIAAKITLHPDVRSKLYPNVIPHGVSDKAVKDFR